MPPESLIQAISISFATLKMNIRNKLVPFAFSTLCSIAAVCLTGFFMVSIGFSIREVRICAVFWFAIAFFVFFKVFTRPESGGRD